MVGQADLARPGDLPAADQARIGNGVMGYPLTTYGNLKKIVGGAFFENNTQVLFSLFPYGKKFNIHLYGVININKVILINLLLTY